MSLITATGAIAARKLVWETFRKVAIQPALDFRGEQFLKAFIEAVAAEKQWSLETSDLDARLSTLLGNEQGQEALLRAHRHVGLSVSRALGPRIVGLLTANLILKNRVASPHDERIFLVAEQLSDADLRTFANNYWDGSRQPRNMALDLSSEPEGYSFFEIFSQESIGPMEPIINEPSPRYAGPPMWVTRLKALGVVEEVDTTTRQTLRGIVDKRTFFTNTKFASLAILIDRATGPVGGKT